MTYNCAGAGRPAARQFWKRGFMSAQQGQDEARAVARALTTHHSRATARAFRSLRAVLATAAVAATALAALTAAAAGTAASAATMQAPTVLAGLTWHPLTLLN